MSAKPYPPTSDLLKVGMMIATYRDHVKGSFLPSCSLSFKPRKPCRTRPSLLSNQSLFYHRDSDRPIFCRERWFWFCALSKGRACENYSSIVRAHFIQIRRPHHARTKRAPPIETRNWEPTEAELRPIGHCFAPRLKSRKKKAVSNYWQTASILDLTSE